MTYMYLLDCLDLILLFVLHILPPNWISQLLCSDNDFVLINCVSM